MFNNLILARTILSDWSGGLTDHVISNIETDSSVINFGYDVTPFSAIIEPGIAGTNFFTNRSGTIRRNLFSDLTIDQTVNIIGLDIPGRFNFYYPPPDLTGSPGILGTDSSYQQYYRSIYRKGAFQEFVKKERDFRGPPNLIIGDSTTSLTVGTGPTILSVDSTRNTLTCGQSVAIIHDSTTQMSGIFIAYEPATKNLFTSIDSSTGSGTYSDWTVEAYSGQFPLNQTTSPGHICDRWVQDTLQPLYEDLRRVCSSSTDSSNIYRSYSIILANRMWSPRWSWENYAGVTPDRTNSGDLYTFSLDTSGYILADATVYRDGILIPGAVESINQNPVVGGSFSSASIITGFQGFHIEPTVNLSIGQHITLKHDFFNLLSGTITYYDSAAGDLTANIDSVVGVGTYSSWSLESYNPSVSLYNTAEYWDATGGGVPTIGTDSTPTEFAFNYYFGGALTTDSTQEFGIAYWQLPRAPITDGSGALAGINNVQVFLDGTWVQNAVIYLEPLTGNIELNAERSFWIDSSAGRIPTQDQTLSFQYYTGNSEYYMLLDDPGYILDDQVVLDADSSTGNSAPIATPLLLGYKFRADLLEHASVLNSGVWNEETYSWEGSTLLLNNYQKPATRASFANQQDSLNHYNYFFSPEFLSDPNPKKILNDQYLDQNINCDADFTSNGVPQGYPVGSTEAVLQLHAGTPPFQKTYSYQPQMIEHRKLKDVRMHHHPLMYADLLIKETTISGDPEVAMSSICDSAPIGIGLGFKDGPVTINECEPWLIMDDPDSILDDVYVFPEFCYNGYKMDATTFYQEYINFLSDYGDGITFKYLNKDTYEVEEHTFSGPVFETYDADQDEVSAIESFPNALIRITKPLNPLTILEDYKFLQDPAIRIRKKTLRELLPDRTFRTFKLYEALPV